MAGISKAKNRIKIGNTDTPYGGSVVDLQYSISFQGTSSIAATVANSSGEYTTPISILNSTYPVLIQFGSAAINMLPVSYKKSKGSGGRTLTVNYEDMGLYYLDKTTVLLRHQHLEAPRGGTTIVLGVNFAEDVNGVSRRYYGRWKSGLVTVQYDIRALGDGIVEHGIPVSSALIKFLGKFKAYTQGGGDVEAPTSFLRSDVGSLRDVLGGVANELGFVFFWNNADGISETGEGRLSPASSFRLKNVSVINAKKNQGFLDFVTFENEVDLRNVMHTADYYSNSCNVLDDSYEVSIKDSYIKGGVGYFAVTPPSFLGKSDRFTRFKFQESIVSPHTGEKVYIKNNYDLELLMRAALMGGDFYKKYVLQKLSCSYLKGGGGDSKDNQYATLSERNEEPLNKDYATFISRGVQREAGRGNPLNIVENSAVNALYKGEKFELVPCVYSKYFSGLAKTQGGAWQDHYPSVRPPRKDAIASNAKWQTVFDDEGFIKNLRSGGTPSEFMGVAYKSTEEINLFIESPDSDPIYTQLLFLAAHYGTIYYRGSSSKPYLLTQELFSNRSYADDVSWVFSDTAAFDTPVGDIFSFLQDGDKDIYEKRGRYTIHKQGQSVCGRPKGLPSNVISPKNRTYTVAEGYKDAVGIYSFLKGNKRPRATGCNAGQTVEQFIKDLYHVGSAGGGAAFASETLSRRSDTSVDFGDVNVTEGGVGGKGGSIDSDMYQELQAYRTECKESNYIFPTDLDYGVVIYDASLGGGVVGGDVEMAFSEYVKSNDMPATDLWYKKESRYLSLEVVQVDVDRNFKSYWGSREADYWDMQVLSGVKMNVPLRKVPSRKYLSYSYTINDLLQSVRAAYVANKGALFNAISKVEVDEVQFDIGSLLGIDDYKYEFPLCEGKQHIDLVKATQTLYKIMANYVEANTSPSISRDFVVSGFGFKDGLDSNERLPSIWQGLESIGIQLTEKGVQTTIKIGNKRRMRASAQMRAQMISKGMPGATSARQTPNQVNNSFSTSLQAKF